ASHPSPQERGQRRHDLWRLVPVVKKPCCLRSKNAQGQLNPIVDQAWKTAGQLFDTSPSKELANYLKKLRIRFRLSRTDSSHRLACPGHPENRRSLCSFSAPVTAHRLEAAACRAWHSPCRESRRSRLLWRRTGAMSSAE